MARVLDPLSGGERHQILQPQVDPHRTAAGTCGSLRRVDHDIEVPVAAPIAREVAAVSDFAFRQRSGVKHPEGVSGKAKSLALALQIPSLERHPGEGFLPAVPQVRTPELTTGRSVLFTHGIHRARMEPQLLARAGREEVQVKAGRPLLFPLQGMFLRIVTVIPHEVHRAALSIQQTRQRLHAVPKHRLHTGYNTSYRVLVNHTRRQRFLPVLKDGVSALEMG